MKKLFASVFVIFGIFCLTSCQSPMKSTEKCSNNLGSSFSAEMSLSLDKLSAEGTIKRLGDGEWEAEFDSPNTLSGVCLRFSSGSVTADYKGLSFSVPKSALPAKSMLLNLIEAVDTNAREPELKGTMNEDRMEICGSLECGTYTLTVDENGYISGFSMPNNQLKMSFSNVTPIAPQLTETTCETTTTTCETTTTACKETAADTEVQAAEECIGEDEAAECITPAEESNSPEAD